MRYYVNKGQHTDPPEKEAGLSALSIVGTKSNTNFRVKLHQLLKEGRGIDRW
ncbi:unnamed protein product [Dibothriocephalus latus]|uniref:Uncharacterized protein n=1 Tax=Dibothriocephalus latus TaxID=60516 RepID=A0A3P7P1W1_DIBLA|nr:unnamed protein product [Dibothriocephalus latus]